MGSPSPPVLSLTLFLSLSFAPPYYVSTLLVLYRVSRVCKMCKSFYIKTLIFGLLFLLLLCFCCCIYCCSCCCFVVVVFVVVVLFAALAGAAKSRRH